MLCQTFGAPPLKCCGLNLPKKMPLKLYNMYNNIDLICKEKDWYVSTLSVHVILPDVDIAHGVSPGDVTHDDTGLGEELVISDKLSRILVILYFEKN